MSQDRNSGRLGTPNANEGAIAQSAEDLFKFPKPTQFVDLPSKGALYPEGHPLYGIKSLEINYMTGKEEDILSNVEYIKRGVAVDKVLESVMIDKNIDINWLLSADKSALVIGARITAYTHEYKTELVCPSCGNKSVYTFDLNNANHYCGYIEDDLAETHLVRKSDQTFEITMPLSEVLVDVKLLTGNEEKNLFNLMKNDAKESAGKISSETLKNIVVAVNGQSHPELIEYFVENAPAADLAFLREKYKLLNQAIDLSQKYECDKCGYAEVIEPPIGLDFLYPRT